jgi:hypothetical protein
VELGEVEDLRLQRALEEESVKDDIVPSKLRPGHRHADGPPAARGASARARPAESRARRRGDRQRAARGGSAVERDGGNGLDEADDEEAAHVPARRGPTRRNCHLKRFEPSDLSEEGCEELKVKLKAFSF